MNDYTEIYSIIWLVFFGICFSAFYAYFTKHFLGGIVRRLVEKSAFDDASAKSLYELGYGRLSAFVLRRFLKQGGVLRRYISVVFPEENKQTDLLVSTDTVTQKYYLVEQTRETATKRYDDKGSSLGALLLTIVVFFALAIVSILVVPLFAGIFSPHESYEENDSSPQEAYTSNVTTESSQSDEDFSMLTPSDNAGTQGE